MNKEKMEERQEKKERGGKRTCGPGRRWVGRGNKWEDGERKGRLLRVRRLASSVYLTVTNAQGQRYAPCHFTDKDTES